MDQSDLIFVRSTLDGVAAGNANVEDAEAARDLVDADISDVVAEVTNNDDEDFANANTPGTDVVPYEGDNDGDKIPF